MRRSVYSANPFCDANPLEAEPSWSGAGTILLVEDQKFIAELLELVFGRAGLSVVRASDGAEAVRLFGGHRSSVRLAMIDFGLPDIPGDELALNLRGLVPGLPVLLTSGREVDGCREKLLATGPTWFAAKPYKTPRLVEQVRALLLTAA